MVKPETDAKMKQVCILRFINEHNDYIQPKFYKTLNQMYKLLDNKPDAVSYNTWNDMAQFEMTSHIFETIEQVLKHYNVQ